MVNKETHQVDPDRIPGYDMVMSRIILAVAMLALQIPIQLNVPVATSPYYHQPALKWNRINTPSEDSIVAPGSDVLQLMAAQDSTLYSVVRDGDCRLYHSEDGGRRWEKLASLEQGFVELVEYRHEAGVLYYATPSMVFRSEDGGRSFSILPWLPGVDGETSFITAIAVASVEGEEIIAATVASSGEGGTRGIFLLKSNEFLSRWCDSGLTSFNAYSVRFIPGYSDEIALAAVGIQEGDFVFKTMIGNAGWSNTWNDGIITSNLKTGLTLEEAVLVFPAGFNPFHPVVLVGLNTEGGGVYRVELASGLTATGVYKLTADGTSAVTSLNVADNGTILAGTATGDLYLSHDHGITWKQPFKPPTGERITSVVALPQGFYVTATGSESAVSFSEDGYHWEQLSWVDTRIDSLLDFAVAPQRCQDKAIYLLTWGGSSSLWYSADGGNSWLRYLNSSVTEGIFEKVCISPEYGRSQEVIYMAGEGSDGFRVWRSADGGKSYVTRNCPLQIDCLEIIGDDELLAGAFDGRCGVILRSQNAGRSYTYSIAGEAPIYSLAVAPGSAGWNILTGDFAGGVYYSENAGVNFCRLSGTDKLSGAISVSFDNAFSENNRIFAASDFPGEGIYSAKVSSEIDWKRLELEDEQVQSRMGCLVVAENGLVYAADLQPLKLEADRGKVMRILRTTQGPAAVEIITKGLDEGCSLGKMISAGNTLWAIDINNNRLLHYTDTLASPPELVFPLDGAKDVGIAGNGYVSNIRLEWEVLPGAAEYHWQVSDNSSFSKIQEDLEGFSDHTELLLPKLDAETSYYWRIRAVKPVSSVWSETGRFKTALPTSVVTPRLEKPLPGERDVVTRPLFQWEKIEGADYYELVVGTNPDFKEPVLTCIGLEALRANACQATDELEYATVYFWKVRAVDAGGASDWSGVGSFRTADPPGQPGVPATESPVTTITLPITTVINIGDIIVVVPPLEIPWQTIVVTQSPGPSYPQITTRMPQYVYVIIVLLGMALFVLLILLTVITVRSRQG
ncbi:MAG: YCF48-related protein [Dehalococcoidales bacterium]